MPHAVRMPRPGQMTEAFFWSPQRPVRQRRKHQSEIVAKDVHTF